MAALVQSPEADARHTETEHITRDTAYTLPDGEFLLGLWKVEYGLLDSVTVGTYHFPWFIKLYNGHVKWRVWQGERWAFGTELGLLHLDFGNLIGALEASDSSASLLIVPWEGLASWRMNEASDNPMGLPHRWLIKPVIPLGALLLIMAGLCNMLRLAVFLAGPQAEAERADPVLAR